MNSRPVLSWGIATSLVAAGALALLLWAAWQPVTVAPANPAASVMLVFAAQAMSPETQVAHAVGARQSAASSAARPPKSAVRQEALPVLARAAAPDLVAAEKVAKAETSPSPDPGKDAAKEASLPAQASSSATPAPSPRARSAGGAVRQRHAARQRGAGQLAKPGARPSGPLQALSG